MTASVGLSGGLSELLLEHLHREFNRESGDGLWHLGGDEGSNRPLTLGVVVVELTLRFTNEAFTLAAPTTPSGCAPAGWTPRGS